MRHEHGFGLVETLAALVVLLAGLAAAAGALIQALRLEAEAAALARATRLGRDLAEELRALPRPDGAAPRSIDGASPAEACASLPTACPAETAASQLRAAWLARMRSELGPEASATIAIDGGDPARIGVDLRRNARAGAVHLVVTP